MKRFDVEEHYTRTYLHPQSGLKPGSIQDRELRRAYFIAISDFMAWLMSESNESTPADIFVERMNEVALQLDTFLDKAVSDAERVRG